MSNRKKIYIAGAGGMLGEAFYEIFSCDYNLKCTDIDVNETWLEYLDFTDRDAYIKDVDEFNPDYLFHLGAFTDLEFCEENKDETEDFEFNQDFGISLFYIFQQLEYLMENKILMMIGIYQILLGIMQEVNMLESYMFKITQIII